MTIAALVLRRPGLVVVTADLDPDDRRRPDLLPAANPISSSAILNLVVSLLVTGRHPRPLRRQLRNSLSRRDPTTARELERPATSSSGQAEALPHDERRARRARSERARRVAEEARRAIEAKVLEVQKLESLGVLAGGIAHDFNNLLVAILGNASLALLDLPRTRPRARASWTIEIASQRAGELARQMLAYSGRSRFVIEPVELSELVRELLTLLQVSIGKGVDPRAPPRRTSRSSSRPTPPSSARS